MILMRADATATRCRSERARHRTPPGNAGGLCRSPLSRQRQTSGQRLPEIAVEQVDVGRERERRRVMSESPLQLYGVTAPRKQARVARVTKRVEPRPPLHTRLLTRR